MNPEMEIGTDKRPSELIWTQASAARSILQIELTPVQEKVSILAIRRKHRYGEFKSQPIN
jgi:hypothetical protein